MSIGHLTEIQEMAFRAFFPWESKKSKTRETLTREGNFLLVREFHALCYPPKIRDTS